MTPILIVTRPKSAAQTFADQVLERLSDPVSVIYSPALEIIPLDPVLPFDPNHIIFTSSNGLRHAARLGISKSTPIWCVGNRTTDLAKSHGYNARFAGESAEALVETMVLQRPNGSILHLSGKHTRGNVVQKLRTAGLVAEQLELYDQRLLPPSEKANKAFAGTQPVVLPLFSPRSTGLLAQTSVTAPLHLVFMSAAVAEAATTTRAVTKTVVSAPDEAQMITATAATLVTLLTHPA